MELALVDQLEFVVTDLLVDLIEAGVGVFWDSIDLKAELNCFTFCVLFLNAHDSNNWWLNSSLWSFHGLQLFINVLAHGSD